ncbi:MAG: carboxypeptidase-like regulatory domain-containing protein, partial [Planctomycetota bacterium]
MTIRCSIVLCLLLSVVATGQETEKLACTVKVVYANAQPVAGAEVAAYEKFYDYSGDEDYVKLLDKIRKTDANGCCLLNVDIQSGDNVFIVSRRKGLALGWDKLHHSVSGNAKAQFTIILETACVLAGMVVDESGNPVTGARIRALPKTSYLRRLEQAPILAPENWFTVHTDDKGHFQFDNFAADVSVDFWVQAADRTTVYKYTTHWTNSCGFASGLTDVRLTLPSEATVKGRVIDADTGLAVAGACLLICPDDVRTHENPYCPKKVVSGKDGQFHFEGVPVGKHYINVSALQDETSQWPDKRVKFDIQADQSVKEVAIQLEKGGLIEFTAREALTRKPISDLAVYFYQARQDEKSSFYKHLKTDEDGMLRIWAPLEECKFSARRDEVAVIPARGKTSSVEMMLDSIFNSTVSGVVLDNSGEPVVSAAVEFHPFGAQVVTDVAGKFKIGTERGDDEKCLVIRDVKRNLAEAIMIVDESKPLKVTVKDGLSITGQITDSAGVGIPAARISLCVDISNCLSSMGSEVITNVRGRYKIKAIPAPKDFSYCLSVHKAGYGPERWKRIAVKGDPGESVKIETIVLQPTDTSISGVVVNTEGKPAARVPIFLHGRDQPSRSTATDAKGFFVVNRISKGPLRLQANFGSSPGGSGSLEAEGGDQNVKIILGQKRVHTKHTSLIDKVLPDLKEFGIELSLAAKEENILVCFFDFEQRPSRHMMRELSKRVDKLKEKGVGVVCVQASKVERVKLDEWVKENKISFSVEMIEGDEEKVRFNWGVKSLPWLILTDEEHVVRAEGFGLEDIVKGIGIYENKSSSEGERKNPPGKTSDSRASLEYRSSEELRELLRKGYTSAKTILKDVRIVYQSKWWQDASWIEDFSGDPKD